MDVLAAVANCLGEDDMRGRLETIQAARREVAAQKRKLTNELRNERRKRERLVKKASCMKTPELLTVLRMRDEQRKKKQQTG